MRPVKIERFIKIDQKIVRDIVKRLDEIAFSECCELDNVETLLHCMAAVAAYASGCVDNPTACSSLDNLHVCIEDLKNAWQAYVDAACKKVIEKTAQKETKQ